jgi:uncharacterized membrane protein
VRTRAGLDRLVTFLDAVVAIAITLLVLPLVDVLGNQAQGSLYDTLSDNAGLFGAFLLSFAVIARFWLIHHRLLEYVDAYDTPFLMVNMAWLLTIVFLPFATQVAALYGAHQRLAVAIYVGTVAMSSLCLTALTILLNRRPALCKEGVQPEQVSPVAGVLSSGLIVLAFVLGVAIPAVNYWALLLLLLSDPLERMVSRRSAAPVDA